MAWATPAVHAAMRELAPKVAGLVVSTEERRRTPSIEARLDDGDIPGWR